MININVNGEDSMEFIKKLILALVLASTASMNSQAMQLNVVKPVVSFLADLETEEAINLGLFIAAFPASYRIGQAMEQMPEPNVSHLIGFTVLGMARYGIPASLLMCGLSHVAKRLNA